MRVGILGLVGAAVIASACGSGTARTGAAGDSSASARVTQVDWPTFDFNAQRTGVGPSDTGITSHNLGELQRMTVRTTGGMVDSSAILLHAVKVRGKVQTVFIVTTDYGRTIAYNAASGRVQWQYSAPSVRSLLGSSQITTATPIVDPGRLAIYASSPDGYIQKLWLSDGHRIWRTRVTYDPTHEKIAGALNIDGSQLVTETDGYDGDAPVYQGHVVTMNRSNGHITHVWNSLCSNVHHLLDPPSHCSISGSAIWGRSGAVVEPRTGNLLVATGNADGQTANSFNGRTNWADSVLELSPKLKLLHNYTPTDTIALSNSDTDLGSTEPALLPVAGGLRFAVQGGKDGVLRLLNLKRLDGTTHGAGRREGGALQTLDAPGSTDVFGEPAVMSIGHGRAYVFVSTGGGTAGYLYGSNHRLKLAWENGIAANNPVVAGGLLYVYAINDGRLDVLNPRTGTVYRSLPAQGGHWNSPIITGGRIILPVGDDNNHQTTGTIYVYHLPGY